MEKTPVFGIVGYSGSGKTTLIEKLLAVFQAQGLRVGVMKHDVHGLSFDREGKDSWRFAQAGAAVTAAVSTAQTVTVEDRPLSPEELAGRIQGVDLILAEGFKTAPWPKLLVCCGEEGEPLAVPLTDCAAVVADGPREFPLPRFRRDDAGGIAAFIRNAPQTADEEEQNGRR